MSGTLVLPRRKEDSDFGRWSVFFAGTATVIIRYAGFTVLTDPDFLPAGDHGHLGYGLMVKRLEPCTSLPEQGFEATE